MTNLNLQLLISAYSVQKTVLNDAKTLLLSHICVRHFNLNGVFLQTKTLKDMYYLVYNLNVSTLEA